MRTKHLLLGIIALLYASVWAYADPIEDGKMIFMSRCAACHNVNKTLTGPALAGVDQRRSMEWIIKFVHSSQTLVKSGDKDAVSVFQQFNKVPMPDHPDLTEENIKSIVEYIKSAAVTTDTKAPFAKPSKLQTVYKPLSISKDYGIFLIYLFAVVLLIAALVFAVRLKSFSAKAE
jgi:mono/diheme cytochrome c family protein